MLLVMVSGAGIRVSGSRLGIESSQQVEVGTAERRVHHLGRVKVRAGRRLRRKGKRAPQHANRRKEKSKIVPPAPSE